MNSRAVGIVAGILFSGSVAWGAPGDILFSDDFDDFDSDGNYTIVAYDSDGDTIDAAYDYFGLGAPGDVRDGTGMYLQTDDAITAYISDLTVTAPISIKFDMYLNYGSPGTTEYLVAGVYHSGSKALSAASAVTNDIDGVFTAASTDGDFLGVGDYIIREGPGSGTNLYAGDAAGDNGDPFPAIFPQIEGSQTTAGTPGFRWTEVEIIADDGVITWILNGAEVATVTYSGTPTGLISFGFADPFPSANTVTTWGVIDNIVVTEIPEPASLLALAAPGLAVAARRRR